jgi:hypothetical protein
MAITHSQKSIAVRPVARLVALAGHEAGDTVGLQSTWQSQHLPAAQLQQRRRILNPQLSALDPQQGIVSVQLAVAHGNHRHQRNS